MKFKIGDVVITKACLHGAISGPLCGTGIECTILSIDLSCPRGIFYETDIIYKGPGPFTHWWGCDQCFEFKRPPRQEVGKWDSCVWQPSPETVNEKGSI